MLHFKLDIHIYAQSALGKDAALKTQADENAVYKGESKSKGKIHLMALIEVTVSSFTYHFST